MTTKNFKFLLILLSLFVISGCPPRLPPSGSDTVGPTISISVLKNGETIEFDSNYDGMNPSLACTKINNFPSTVVISANDAGGIEELGVRVFPDNAILTSTAPSSSTVDSRLVGSSRLIQSRPNPGTGLVQTNSTITLSIEAFSAMRAFAIDERGNSTETYQFDLRDQDDPVICQ